MSRTAIARTGDDGRNTDTMERLRADELAFERDLYGFPESGSTKRAGRRRAEQLGERFSHGGYPHITADEWVEHDLAMREWEQRRRDRLK